MTGFQQTLGNLTLSPFLLDGQIHHLALKLQTLIKPRLLSQHLFYCNLFYHSLFNGKIIFFKILKICSIFSVIGNKLTCHKQAKEDYVHKQYSKYAFQIFQNKPYSKPSSALFCYLGSTAFAVQYVFVLHIQTLKVFHKTSIAR